MPTRSLPLGASVVLCMVAAAGCGDGGGGWVPASADPRRNVLVIDDGFDLTAPELGGRVAAAYTVVCEPGAPAGTDGGAGGASNGGGTGGGGGASGAAGTGGDGGAAGAAGAGGAGETFADRKQRFIAALAIPDERCGLAEGVRSKPRPLGAVARYRQRWNDMLRRQRDPTSVFSANEWAEITAAVNTELGSFPYHGTSTAGTITHLNPEVRLVLVELDLGTDQSVRDSVTCIEQAELDEAVALLADPEVRDAYVSRPASRLGRDIAHLAEVFRVGIVNESFGTLPRAAVEQVLQEKGCPAVDLVPYFTTYNEADQARAAALAGRPMVQVQAAGNDATQIDAPWDSRECAPGRPTSLLVGSYDLAGRRSSFSNFGACVDVYAPGEWVVVPYPGGWLLPVFGTSFSAPLTARLVSLSAPSPFEPAGARAALVGQRLADGSLPLDLFPPSFFYVPETGSGPRPSPLTASQAAPGGGAAPRAAPLPGRRARPTRRRFDPRPLLEPLQRLRQISGRRISLFR